MSALKEKSKNVAVLGLFSAVTVVCQMISYTVKIGTFNLSLVLIPIVLAAVMYGEKYGAVLGGVFGAVVVIASATGLDSGGFILFSASPFLTTLVCMLKGILAGFLAGAAAKPFKDKKPLLAVVLAAAAAPVVNTGIFVAAMFLFFKDILISWAGGGNIAYYVVFSLVGINFVIEFLINVIFSPQIAHLIKVVKKSLKR